MIHRGRVASLKHIKHMLMENNIPGSGKYNDHFKIIAFLFFGGCFMQKVYI